MNRRRHRGITRAGGTLRPIANRTKQPFINTHGSDGTNTQGKYLSRHKVFPGGCRGGFRLVYANRTREAAAFNTITVAARVRYPSGTGAWQTVKFSGANNVAITSGGNDVTSDALNLIIPAGARFDVETYVTVASAGQKWPTLDGVSLLAANGEGSLLSTSDISGSSVTPSNTTEFYGPIAILGKSKAARAIAVIGDSIANGASDTLTGDRIGFIERVFGDTYPVLQLASSGEKISDFVTAHTQRMAQLAASGITDIVFAFGTNDVANGDNYTTLRGALLSLLAHLAAQGKAITICPVLVKCATDVNTPAANYTVGGNADQLNTFLSGSDIGLVSKVWNTRTAWQNGSNQILSGTYTDDLLHPNATGNAAIAAGAPAVSTLLAAAVPTEPVAPAYVSSNFKIFHAQDLAASLADDADITTWVSRDGTLTATWAGEKPKLKKAITAGGKAVVRFSTGGTGLQKLVVPKGSLVDNIFANGAFGQMVTISKYATAGGNGTGRVWTKGAAETEALSSATNLRTTVDYNTGDIALNGTTAASTWYVRQVYKNASEAGNLLQNTLTTATATGSGSTNHVDNSANDLIIGNHDSLGRGWDGDLALLAFKKGGTTDTADQIWAAQAYFRALSGVTLI